ncbi:hypothetical protein [Cecembia calidifontis]|uniref:Outer membrane protein with beta-barrel domain n=1 Tax=Cecembia calidifontis TaxID=1187080 RepID=A0A4Q7P654_9BACT|nr:hypothetical protein [Cecembia calidifontis]RZS95464.1 hypothetical protein BC751_0996 [Cecembia calidifontis]
MKRWFLFLSFLLVQVAVFGQDKQRTLFWNAGTHNAWERDFAYSPLLYSGASFGFTLGYASVGEKKTDEVYLHYSRIPMQNAFDANMAGTHAHVMTYTFYKASWLPEKFTLGWSNNNALSLRNFEDAQNFNPRFDFHTSFGPAVQYQTLFGKVEQWRFSSQAHFQVTGFLFSASYVTSPPDPFLHEQSTFNAFWQSIRFFQPFQQQDLGILNQLFYQLSNGNEIGVGYRFNYTNLENAQRSQRSIGHYFFQFNFQL